MLAAIIAVPGGRFASEVQGRPQACRHLSVGLERVCGRLRSIGPDGGQLVGFAILEGWRLVLDKAAHADTYMLMLANIATNPRKDGQRFIEHKVLASGSLTTMPTCDGWDHLPPGVTGRRMVADAWDWPITLANVSTIPGPNVNVSTVGQMVKAWEAANGVPVAGNCIAWPACPMLARALVTSNWFGDVTVKFRRGPSTVEAMGLPISSRLVHRFVLHPVELTGPIVVQPVAMEPTHKGSVQAIPVDALVSAMQVGHISGSMTKVRKVVNASAGLLRTSDSHELGSAIADNAVPMPSKWSMQRSRVQLDVASMLMHRDWYKRCGPTFRYLAYDASPQHGLEVFACGERVVRRSDVQPWDDGKPDVSIRCLPLTTLGVGRMGTADKTQALAHQIWLEYGPAEDTMRQANADVRQCLSDMGVEVHLADVQDVLTACIGLKQGKGSVASAKPHGHMFPYALGVPGCQHLIDACMRSALEGLSWWPEWQKCAKAVSQWIQPQMRRDFLAKHIEQLGGDAQQVWRQASSLRHGCDRFADWRWQTLGNVCRDLARMEEAVVSAVMSMQSVAEVCSRDGPSAQAFFDAARDEGFWKRPRCCCISSNP